jgi:hypothetical protein
MTEQAYTPPETKYEVHIDELMKAIKGEPFVQGNGLYRKTAEDTIDFFEDVVFNLDPNQEYIILTESIVTGNKIIALLNEELVDYSIGVVFYKSILPGIRLCNTKTGSWFFYNSKCGDIRISKESHCGDIEFDNNSLCGNIRIDHYSHCGDIGIKNCSRIHYILVDSQSHLGNIWIQNQSQCADIEVKDYGKSSLISVEGESKAGSIKVNNFGESGDIDINQNSQCDYIIIQQQGKCGNVSIRDKSKSTTVYILMTSQCGNIIIFLNSQVDNVSICNDSQAGNILIFKNKKILSVDITDNGKIGKLDFVNATLSSVTIENSFLALKLYNTEFQLMKITESFITSLDWQVGTKGDFYISQQSEVMHFQMANTTILKDNVFSLSDTIVRYCIMEEVLVQGNLLLRKIMPPTHSFAGKYKLGINTQRLVNEQSVKLKKQYGEPPLFRISHSSLGKTEITGCDLTGFMFEYYNSKLLDSFITGTHLPKSNIAIYNPVAPGTPVAKKEEYEQKTSIYNQFKKIYENQGDVVEASWYHAKAMENQQALLQLIYRAEPRPWYKKILGEKGFDLFGFRLNRFSNNHGESWRRAIRFVLLGSGIMYSLYYLSVHYREPFGFGATGRFFGDYFSFLDITHRIDFHVPKEQLNGWSKFLDYFGKLVIGYGLYQLIAAFRRHGKKAG